MGEVRIEALPLCFGARDGGGFPCFLGLRVNPLGLVTIVAEDTFLPML